MPKVTSRKWDVNRIGDRLSERGKALTAGATEALELSIAEGALYTQDALEAAVTQTGLRREEETGGFPGRHDSGNMVGSLSWELRRKAARVLQGVFGWWGGNFEEYFRDQDEGEGNIPAARALPVAFLLARENFRRRLDSLVKHGTVD